MFEAVQKRSLSDAVYRQLSLRIVNQELQAGDALPSERILSEMLGVNRGAVREAIKRLQQAGLVAVRQGGNSIVQDYLNEGGLELLPHLLVNSEGQINATVARSIMGMRASLAPSVAASAARKANPRLADQLESILSQMREMDHDSSALQELALEYWQLLVKAGGNIAFRLAFNSMNKTYRTVWSLLTQILQDEFRDQKNMGLLAQAVRVGDSEAARSAATAHINIGSQAMDRTLAEYERASGANS